MKSSNKLGKRKGYHCQYKVYEKGIFFVKNVLEKGNGLELGEEPPRMKLVEYHPLPCWDCASVFGNHVEFTIIKGEPILTVENCYKFFFFFFSKQY